MGVKVYLSIIFQLVPKRTVHLPLIHSPRSPRYYSASDPAKAQTGVNVLGAATSCDGPESCTGKSATAIYVLPPLNKPGLDSGQMHPYEVPRDNLGADLAYISLYRLSNQLFCLNLILVLVTAKYELATVV